jgi:hypothetical protein
MEWCVARGREPIDECDFESISGEEPPQDASYRDTIILAMRQGKLAHTGDLYRVIEDLSSETALPFDLGTVQEEQLWDLRTEYKSLMETNEFLLKEGFSIDPCQWRAERINWDASAIDFTDRPVGVDALVRSHSRLGSTWYRLDQIRVSVKDLRTIVPGPTSAPMMSTGATRLAPDVSRNKGGAKKKFDWEWIWVEVAVIIDLDGLPDNQNELVRMIQERYEARFGEEPPGDSILKEKFKRIYNHPRKTGPR